MIKIYVPRDSSALAVGTFEIIAVANIAKSKIAATAPGKRELLRSVFVG